MLAETPFGAILSPRVHELIVRFRFTDARSCQTGSDLIPVVLPHCEFPKAADRRRKGNVGSCGLYDPRVNGSSAAWRTRKLSDCLRPQIANRRISLSDGLVQKRTERFPDEFRLPIGARKCEATEPAIRRLIAMGISGFGRLWDGTERMGEVNRQGRVER